MVYNGLARAAREHVATECRYGAVLGRGHGCRALLVRGHLGARSTGAGAKPQVFAHGGAVRRVEHRGSTDHRISGGPNRRVTLGPVVALTTHTPGGVPLLIIGPDSDPGLNSRQLGQITADHNPATGDFQVSAQVSQRATSDEIATFCDWVDTEVSQLLETGDPDGNGWVLETDVPDRWHKAAFPLELPDT